MTGPAARAARDWRDVVRGTSRTVLDFVFPIACVSCGAQIAQRARPAQLICGVCWAALPLLPHPQCDRCGEPLRLGSATTHATCVRCDLLPPYVRACRSVCWVPDGTGGEMVRALKYGGWRATADAIGLRIGSLTWPADVEAERVAVVPVPLGRGRLRERGFNQSALLARAAAGRWRLPMWDDVLERSRATQAQARLTAADRLTNVAGAFRVPDSVQTRLRGAHVMLVDDVVTTAATLNACAAALVAGGARVVSYATFGRARS